jgi:hypothetical protein
MKSKLKKEYAKVLKEEGVESSRLKSKDKRGEGRDAGDNNDGTFFSSLAPEDADLVRLIGPPSLPSKDLRRSDFVEGGGRRVVQAEEQGQAGRRTGCRGQQRRERYDRWWSRKV